MKPLIGLCLAAASVTCAAQTQPKPEKVVICAACHGENGVSTQPMYPNLAGQYENYLQQALVAYRSDVRKNAIMDAQAHNLSDEDIKELATWFSEQKPVVYTPDIDGKAK